MGFNANYLKTPSGILKLFEIICVIVAFSLFRGSQANFYTEDANYFGGGVLVTALIITPLLLTCYLMGKMEIQKTILEVAVNFLMFVFLMADGALTVDHYSKYPFSHKMKSESLAMGSFCIIGSLLYGVDTVFAGMEYNK